LGGPIILGFLPAIDDRERVALPPLNQRGDPMCHECDDIDRQISHYRTFLKQSFDVLTLERIKELVADLQRDRDAKHPDRVI
jgi:hypothetical protein